MGDMSKAPRRGEAKKAAGGKRYRPDKDGPHRGQAERNRKKILATQEICAICGRRVDKTLPYPDPWSATIDHIIPVARGGHPSALDNMQLAHLRCNRLKSDKLSIDKNDDMGAAEKPPWSIDWLAYRGK